jgi:hypothetical protein
MPAIGAEAGRTVGVVFRHHVSQQKALKCKISCPIVVDLRTKNPNLEHSPNSIMDVHPSWWTLDAKAYRNKEGAWQQDGGNRKDVTAIKASATIRMQLLKVDAARSRNCTKSATA